MPYPREGPDQSGYSYQDRDTTHVCPGNYYWRAIILAEEIVIIQLLAITLNSRLIDPVRHEAGVLRKMGR